jgi:putative membrane protein insertion efficiency factor
MPQSLKAANAVEPSRGLRQGLLRTAFQAYKAILSPVLHSLSPSRCLYLPTCSEYAYTAISRFGMVRGTWLAARRFSRCHPWGKGGFDPLPERFSSECAHPVAASSSGPCRKGVDHLP